MKYFVSLLTILLLFTACEEVVDADCTTLITESSEAAVAFEANMSDSTLCAANVTAYQAALDGECEGYTSDIATSFSTICTTLTTDCTELILAVSDALIAFNADASDSTLCAANLNAYQTALNSACEGFTSADATSYSDLCISLLPNEEVTDLSVVGSWELLSLTMDIRMTTNEDATVMIEDEVGTGAIIVTDGDESISLDRLDLNDDDGDGAVDRIEATYNDEEEDIRAEYSIGTDTDYDGDTMISSYFNYNDWDNGDFIHCYSNGDFLDYTVDPETFTLTVNSDVLNCGGDDEMTIHVSGTLTGASIDIQANVETVVMEDSGDPDEYEHLYLTFNADGTVTDSESVDCELITDDEECGDYGCVWDETAVSCGQFTGSCSDFERDDCYDNDWHCGWDYDEEQCAPWDDDDEGSDTWLLSADGTLSISDSEEYYEYYEDYGDSLVTHTWTDLFNTTLNGDILTLSTSINPCDLDDEDNYYGYYISYYCEYEGLTDEECSAECLDMMAEDLYGLEEGMLVSISQNMSISLLSVDLGRFMDNANGFHFVHKKMRQKLAKGIANHLRQMAQ